MSSPLISVAVSAHAAERHIRGCLEMLLRQTVADRLEIIVIDSGSGSGSPELERTIVEALQRQHHNIVYLRTPRETLYAAWNRALSMSSGKYFANVNTDDWICAGDGRHQAAGSHLRVGSDLVKCRLTPQPNPEGAVLPGVLRRGPQVSLRGRPGDDRWGGS